MVVLLLIKFSNKHNNYGVRSEAYFVTVPKITIF